MTTYPQHIVAEACRIANEQPLSTSGYTPRLDSANPYIQSICLALTMTPPEPPKDVLVEALVKHMAERFLAWKLPADFSPDNGISAKRPAYGPGVLWEPMGTNLFHYAQAEAMVRHMIEGFPIRQPVSEEVIEREAGDATDCDRYSYAQGLRRGIELAGGK